MRRFFGFLLLVSGMGLVGTACSSTTKPDAAATPVEELCTRYCDTLEDNCTGEFEQFNTRARCEAFCLLLPEGSDSGNTIQCRTRQAELAGELGEPAAHCTEAGPGGAEVCGDNCDAYCLVLEQACTGGFQSNFNGIADCSQHCEEVPSIGRYNSSIDAGDSIECRLWHLSAAAVDPDIHCSHSLGEPPCAE